MSSFIVIGITDHPQPFFPPEVMTIIKSGTVFSGGKRHHEIVAPLLPENAEWIDIVPPLEQVFAQYKLAFEWLRRQPIVVFASGDPLFFGFANAVRERAVTHYGQPALDASATRTRKRRIGNSGGWGFQSTDEADATLIEAAALARWAAVTTKRDPRRKAVVW